MGTEPHQLHVVFFPLMAPGHTIPILDIVCLFAARQVKTTILTTPLNASNITTSFDKCKADARSNINIETFPFPSEEAGLPEGIENLESVTSPDMGFKFLLSLELLKDPLERFLENRRPDCLVADMFFPFATDVATKLGIPRIVFQGISFFATCATVVMKQYEPHMSAFGDDELFVIPNLPHEVKLTKSQMFHEYTDNLSFIKLLDAAHEAERKSFGNIFNSFYELEPDYADYYRKVLRRQGWHIGPVSLHNRKTEEKFHRGNKASINEHECLKWLDSKELNSVIYICFGSLTLFSEPQLKEIALALESSGQRFIWVVKKGKDENEGWLSDEFMKRMQGQGLIIKGWAPQVLILDHQAIGGFVTHCGWNSTLEAISAGVPMITWPLFAEQFYNEKLVTDILKIGVQVGSKQWNAMTEGTFVKHGSIEAAFKRIMGGDEVVDMRNRAKKLQDMARLAVDAGGSSYNDLNALIQGLSLCQP